MSFERQSQSLEQLAPIVRSRGEYDQWTSHLTSVDAVMRTVGCPWHGTASQPMSADFPLRTSPTIDSFAFARAGRRMEGEVAVSQLPRLSELVTASDDALRYEITGLIDDEGYPAANLRLKGQLNLTCQRCNSPLQFGFDRTTRFRFIDSEEELNALPIEDDEIEAVVGSRNMSVHDWVEDEAILSLPLVPRHDKCQSAVGSKETVGPVSAWNPFAALLALPTMTRHKRLNRAHWRGTARVQSPPFRGVSHGCPAKQEVIFEAWDASLSRRSDESCDGDRADHRRGSSSAPRQPHRFLPRQEGYSNQERRVNRAARSELGGVRAIFQ